MKARSSVLPPGARGRRYKLFPDGDVFIYRKRPDDGSLEPLARTDEAGDSVALQFHNVEEAKGYLRAETLKDFAGQTIIIAEIRRLFVVEAEEKVKVSLTEKKRMLAEPKTSRTLKVDVSVEKEEGRETA